MPIIQFAVGCLGAIAIALWGSAASLAAKIIISGLLFGEAFTFAYTQLEAAGNDTVRRIGVVLCALVNAGVLLFGLHLADVMLAVTAGISCVMLIVWSVAASVFVRGK